MKKRPRLRSRLPLLAFVLLMAMVPTLPTRAAGISWKLKFEDHFNGTKIDESSWGVYGKNGPKGDHCWWDRNITVSGGLATLKVLPSSQCDGYSAAGMCACPVATQKYGKFVVRMKATEGNSKITFLLWADVDWPPEIDFAEFPDHGDGELRQHYTHTLHYGDNNSQIHSSHDADMTEWHNVGVRWSPGLLQYTLDGVVTDTITDHVPAEKMWMALQTDGSSESYAAYTYIEWVKVYTYEGP
jgi:beta-glucanase (GH16 family)